MVVVGDAEMQFKIQGDGVVEHFWPFDSEAIRFNEEIVEAKRGEVGILQAIGVHVG